MLTPVLEKIKKDWKKIGIGAVVFIILLQFLMIFSIKTQIGSIHRGNSQAIYEVGQARDFITEFGTDLNEIRNLLLLPTKSYSFEEVEEVTEEDSTLMADIFMYVSQIGTQKALEEKAAELEVYFSSQSTLDLLESKNLTITQEYEIINDANITFLSFSITDDGDYSITNYFAEPLASIEEAMASLDDIMARFDEFEMTRGKLRTMLYVEGEAYEALYSRGMWSEAEYDIGEALEYYIVNHDQDRLAMISLSKLGQADLNEVTWYDYTADEMFPVAIDNTELASLINELNATTSMERKIAEQEEIIQDLLEDKGFQTALEDNNLKIADEPREEDTATYFDIYDLEDNLVVSIYIDHNTGKVMIATPDGTTEELLAAIQDDTTKKKLSTCLTSFQSTKV